MLVGSHNLESVELAKKLLQEKGVASRQGVIFGQLKGFSDQITGSLANQEFNVIKYLPYGPTEKVMPYLIRRG